MRAAVGPGVGEYLRVDELATRFGVPIDDVLAACALLGFPAHGPESLIELDEFTHAVMTTPPRQQALRRRTRTPMVLSAAAVLLAVVAAFVAVRGTGSGSSGDARTQRAAAAYQAKLASTYQATVGAAPKATDYRALAQELTQITPPAEFRAEHDKLVAEAAEVAAMADSSSPAEDAPSADDLTSAVDALANHVAQVDGAPAPRRLP